MSENRIDPERMAALLDGRLQGKEREALLVELAASPEEYEVFADAAGVQRELALDGAVRAEPSPRRVPGRFNGWLALAACLAGLGVLSWFQLRTTDEEFVTDPRRIVALLEPGVGLPATFDPSPWSGSRGGSGASDQQRRAVRVGARIVDLELAIAAGDPRAQAAAANIRAMLDSTSGGPAVSGPFATLAERAADAPAELDALLESGRAAVVTLFGPDDVAVGAWLEAARVAAARSEAEFFARPATREAIDVIARRAPPESTAIAARLREQIDGQPVDWSVVNRELVALLALLGG